MRIMWESEYCTYTPSAIFLIALLLPANIYLSKPYVQVVCVSLAVGLERLYRGIHDILTRRLTNSIWLSGTDSIVYPDAALVGKMAQRKTPSIAAGASD